MVNIHRSKAPFGWIISDFYILFDDMMRFPHWVVLSLTFATVAFFPYHPQPRQTSQGQCVPGSLYSVGYTFLTPGIVDVRSAYAPFFTQWGSFYRDSFATIDWQRKENVEEWANRFCDLPDPKDVEDVVYHYRANDLQYLRDLAVRRKGDISKLPFPVGGNTLAECIVYNGCTEPVDYLLFARKCEDYAVARAVKWRLQPDNRRFMEQLMREAESRIQQTESHFIKLRYVYQLVRLAHYSGQPQLVVDLYNRYMPTIDQRKPSIVFFWTLGHAAGALQQLGRYADAAYKFSLVFKYCPGKRRQAFDSFKFRNDEDWAAALQQCVDDSERATLYLMRAGRYKSAMLDDLQQVYALDPANPQLSILLVGQVQYLEKYLIRTPVSDRRYGVEQSKIRVKNAANQLIDLQEFVVRVLNEGKAVDLPLWRCMKGYLALMANDQYAAEQAFQSVELTLDNSAYSNVLREQIGIWRTLAEILGMETDGTLTYAKAKALQTYASFKQHPDFGPFLQDYLADYFERKNASGLSDITVYGIDGLLHNPDIRELDRLILLGRQGNADFESIAAEYDTSAGFEMLKNQLLEWKGMAMLNRGEPEAAALTLRSVSKVHQSRMKVFAPFAEFVVEKKPGAAVADSTNVNRVDFVNRLIDLEMQAKAYESFEPNISAWYYYLMGLGYYNTSYFGYDPWLRDRRIDGKNWLRLPQGPVYPMLNTPNGNRENIDMTQPLELFERAFNLTTEPELKARAAFMAARCEQKAWFCDPQCNYRPGSALIPVFPTARYRYFDILLKNYSDTEFAKRAIKECKWLAAYAN
jgi:hypothetical protein